MRWLMIFAAMAIHGGSVQAAAKRVEIKQRLDAIARSTGDIRPSEAADESAKGSRFAQWLNNAPFNNFNNWNNA